MARRGWNSAAAYIGLLAAVAAISIPLSWWLGGPLDNAAYDYLLRAAAPKPWQTEAMLLAVDEETLMSIPGGMQGIRRPLAHGMRLLSAAHPKAVAVDV